MIDIVSTDRQVKGCQMSDISVIVWPFKAPIFIIIRFDLIIKLQVHRIAQALKSRPALVLTHCHRPLLMRR